ncbi:MAG TPA: peptide chain release factor 2 [Thermoanaerobaculia bacterium]|nr:peptide chain release factor 2 [Thermoanaerobaculia bacterium]
MTERDDLVTALTAASERLGALRGYLDLDAARSALDGLREKSAAPDFWSRQEEAQDVLRQTRALERRLETAAKLDDWRGELDTLAELLREGEPAEKDAREALRAAQVFADELELSVKMSAPEDANNAWLSIHAGAGGTESQDWAEMLLRMYMRFMEARGWKAELIDRQDGEEAGLKSATLHVVGDHAYGYLKGEMGVHRLVRISPFDSAKRRHTSFASVYVAPEIDENIEIEIADKDIRVDTYRSSGAGGQHVNVTDSAVRITHLPTGIVVTCQNERSQGRNRDMAMRVLRARLYQRALDERRAEEEKRVGEKKSIEWGSQIRSYVLHPYRMVKDHRTGEETGDTDAVLDGGLTPFVESFLKWSAEGSPARVP